MIISKGLYRTVWAFGFLLLGVCGIRGCDYRFHVGSSIGMQTDIFDDSLIRMKTGGYEEPDFEMTM